MATGRWIGRRSPPTTSPFDKRWSVDPGEPRASRQDSPEPADEEGEPVNVAKYGKLSRCARNRRDAPVYEIRQRVDEIREHATVAKYGLTSLVDAYPS